MYGIHPWENTQIASLKLSNRWQTWDNIVKNKKPVLG